LFRCCFAVNGSEEFAKRECEKVGGEGRGGQAKNGRLENFR
jgi:hypothetical protein